MYGHGVLQLLVSLGASECSFPEAYRHSHKKEKEQKEKKKKLKRKKNWECLFLCSVVQVAFRGPCDADLVICLSFSLVVLGCQRKFQREDWEDWFGNGNSCLTFKVAI